MSEGADSVHAVSVDSCKISKVVVYRDRAEVTRIFEGILPVGSVCLTISDITTKASLETVNVKPLSARRCDILEVTHDLVTKPRVDSSTEAAADGKDHLRVQQTQLEDELSTLNKQRERLESRIKLTNTYADTALREAKTKEGGGIEFARSVLGFHQEEMERLDRDVAAQRKLIQGAEERLQKVKKDLSTKGTTSDASSGGGRGNSVGVVFQCNVMQLRLSVAQSESDANSPVTISFSYIVTGASWTPSYDVRVQTQQQEDILSLSYFGEVTQSTGEDWADCHLSLSTSNPSVSATPPRMLRKTVDFAPAYASYGRRGSGLFQPVEITGGRMERAASFSLMDDVGGFPGQQMMQNTLSQRHDQTVAYQKAAVEGTGDAGSTVFTLSNKVTSIPSDGKAHKVMITARRFRPHLVHYCVPAQAPHVYLQAKARNASGYPLLASQKVQIYLDGTFVSKSTFKQTNNGELFELFLGVDPAIKVDYQPTRYEEFKKGWLSGSTEGKKVFHKTVVQNTKSGACRLILTDSLPLSCQEKIVVELLEPAAASLTTDTSKVALEGSLAQLSGITAAEGTESAAATAAAASAAAASAAAPAAGSDAPPPVYEAKWPADFVTKNKASNSLVWFRTLEPGAKLEIPFSYKVTWPQGQNVDFSSVEY